MSARYVVISQVDDALRVFGIFWDRARAESLADKVNDEVSKREDQEFADWQSAYQGEDSQDEMAPTGRGRARVWAVHPWRYREALAFALTGNPDPALARKGAA